jgi:hypothetical protein
LRFCLVIWCLFEWFVLVRSFGIGKNSFHVEEKIATLEVAVLCVIGSVFFLVLRAYLEPTSQCMLKTYRGVGCTNQFGAY